MADDPDGSIGFRWWYDELSSSGAKILAYCFAEYEAAVARNPSVRAFIPQDETTVEAAIARKYAELNDVISEKFQVTKSVRDTVKRTDVHFEICDTLKERRTNNVFMQRVREALRRLGVKEDEESGTYVGLKRVGTIGGVPKVPTLVKGGSK
jgi:hypothetical protein